MITCLNCEEQFSKYMTQQVSKDTFPSLKAKAEKFGYDEYRVCESCYDKLSEELTSSASVSNLHPMFRGQESSE